MEGRDKVLENRGLKSIRIDLNKLNMKSSIKTQGIKNNRTSKLILSNQN